MEKIPDNFSFESSLEPTLPKLESGQEIGVDFYLDADGSRYISQIGEDMLVISAEQAKAHLAAGETNFFGHGIIGDRNEAGELIVNLSEEGEDSFNLEEAAQ
jgi:hypothetical protein